MKYSCWKTALKNYVKNNYKVFILVTILYIIGIFTGVIIINHSSDNQIVEITTYINSVLAKYKEIENINNIILITQAIKKNLIFAIIIWIAGTTVIGIPIVLILAFTRGTILGFTISSIINTIGFLKGLEFCMASLVLHNIIYIPAMLTMGVSSIKLSKDIIKYNRKDNLKAEILRHTIISITMMLLLIISAIIENTVSIKALKGVIKYF